MRRIINVIVGLCLLSGIAVSQDNYPVEGISDERPGKFALIGAKVILSYDSEPVETDILIVKSRIEAIGKNLKFPKGTTVINLEGKTIYPSFIDIYTSYGVPQESRESSSPMAMFTRQTQRGGPAQEEEPRVADYWNQGIHESYNVLSEFKPDDDKAGEYRKAGFGTVLTFKNNGIARGTSALVSLADDKANNVVLKDHASSNYSFNRGASEDMYPTAQYGAIALLRQFYLDGEWYRKLPEGYFYDASLEALKENKNVPKIFETEDKYEILRADAIGDEFGIDYIIRGSGNEYQLLDEIRKAGVKLILPLNFPDAPDVKDPYEAATVPLSELKHWEMAPANAKMVSGAGIEFALTTDELSKPGDFQEKIGKAVEMGLDKKEALKAITYTPAKMMGAENLVGSIGEGMVANILVTSGDIFDKDCIIYENWIQGKPYRFIDPNMDDICGDYILTAGDEAFDMSIEGRPDKPTIKIEAGEKELKSAITFENDLININITTEEGIIILSGAFYDGTLKGDGILADGQKCTWKTTEAAGKDEEEEKEKEKEKGAHGGYAALGLKVPGKTGPPAGATAQANDDKSIGKVIYPFVAYGFEEIPEQEKILFRNATVWTLDEEGRIEGADVLIDKGKIIGVGQDLKALDARLIDATGMHLTPGIIDEHSHIAMSSTNESGQVISAEVCVGDIIDPGDNSIYRQLSGGVTAAHLLHGSANPIGGQSVLIKHRWGSPAEEMKIKDQVGFLKHALGENVKRSTSRYPNSRMGVEHIIRDAYQRALDYRAEWERYNVLSPEDKKSVIPPRRDLELEALVDVLEKRSFITCHTYVQSEGVMLMRVAEDFGIKVHTFIHFNEGYKVADKIREHGAAASVFSDWWDYKYEVYEGISYNAATLVQQGVLTCLHSDNAEMSRRLHQEAGKTVKYGGLDQVEALKLVTLNPAKILHLDHRMGSIEEGKDADLVLWTDNPLSIYTRAKMTLVDGKVYFDEDKDAEMKKKIDKERNRIIQKILKEGVSKQRPSEISRRTF
ncbi:MAG: amidohydrolase family protein [Bacteroidota bacterium]|nr:amidohydrolase family protein [Bacteroidota bacterium]